MRTCLLSFLLIASTANLMAQPVLNSTDMLQFGVRMQLREVQNFSAIDTTIQGAGVTWDFSNLVSKGASSDVIITTADPSQTPYGNNFPASNYAYKEETPATHYRYFILDTAKFERIGSWSGGTLNYFSDFQTELVFPLTLGTINHDTWDNSNSSFGGGYYNLECIGYGTLIMPWGTHNDALLVRVNFDEGGFLVFDVYFWYSSQNGSTLLQYVVGDGFFIASVARYQLSLTTDIPDGPIISGLHYNNPVRDHFSLSFSSSDASGLKYVLQNGVGQYLLSGSIPESPETRKHLTLDMGHLPQGIYFLSIHHPQFPERSSTIKVVRQ